MIWVLSPPEGFANDYGLLPNLLVTNQRLGLRQTVLPLAEDKDDFFAEGSASAEGKARWKTHIMDRRR